MPEGQHRRVDGKATGRATYSLAAVTGGRDDVRAPDSPCNAHACPDAVIGLMRVWTIHGPEVLAVLRSGSVWRAGESRVEPAWIPAYRWMAREMRDRLGAPAERRQMPIWVWCQWRGVSRRKPDLRSRGHLPTGATGVRIELELDEERVLCSDFQLWHYALNGWYLPESLADERDFAAHPDRGRIATSWRRMFDLEWRNRRYAPVLAEKSIQGVTWELRPQDVRRSTSFVAR